MEFIGLVLALFIAHWVCDFSLETPSMAAAKTSGPHRVYARVAHAGTHAGAVLFLTGNLWVALAEWVSHLIVERMVTENITTSGKAQIYHLSFQLLWASAAMGL